MGRAARRITVVPETGDDFARLDNATRFLIRVGWPLVLAFRLAVYAVYDNPTHLGLWGATRVQHAAVYLAAAAAVVLTVGPTRRRLLELKAGAIFAVGFSSALADLIAVDAPNPARFNSAAGWIVLLYGNVLAVWLRLFDVDDRGRV